MSIPALSRTQDRVAIDGKRVAATTRRHVSCLDLSSRSAAFFCRPVALSPCRPPSPSPSRQMQRQMQRQRARRAHVGGKTHSSCHGDHPTKSARDPRGSSPHGIWDGLARRVRVDKATESHPTNDPAPGCTLRGQPSSDARDTRDNKGQQGTTRDNKGHKRHRRHNKEHKDRRSTLELGAGQGSSSYMYGTYVHTTVSST